MPNLLLSAAVFCDITAYLYTPPFQNIQVFGYETIKYQWGTKLFIALSVLPRVGVRGITNLDCYTVGILCSLIYSIGDSVVSLKYSRVKGDMSPDSYSAMPV